MTLSTESHLIRNNVKGYRDSQATIVKIIWQTCGRMKTNNNP